ncbi:MAG: hypothetical protein HQK88_16665 [Nitrospirae bacterium]|nr:hypothetical protein [Nitrospirota bacterium]MBF0618433.1 hypothetical protein [Nitrospirota bacterium]
MGPLNEEIISPEKYLNLTAEERRNIIKISPIVKKLGSCDIDDSLFAAIRIKWKTPRYTIKL